MNPSFETENRSVISSGCCNKIYIFITKATIQTSLPCSPSSLLLLSSIIISILMSRCIAAEYSPFLQLAVHLIKAPPIQMTGIHFCQPNLGAPQFRCQSRVQLLSRSPIDNSAPASDSGEARVCSRERGSLKVVAVHATPSTGTEGFFLCCIFLPK